MAATNVTGGFVDKILLVRALPCAVHGRAAVLAAQKLLIVTQGAVKEGQLTQLHALQLVLRLGRLNGQLNNLLHLVHTLLQYSRRCPCNEGVQRVVRILAGLTVAAAWVERGGRG